MTDEELIQKIIEACGPQAVVSAKDSVGRPLQILFGQTLHEVPVLRPASTQDVVAIMKLTRAAGKTLVTLGGATGLAGGTLPATREEWYMSTERMKRIVEIDNVSRYAVVESGVVLQTLQEAAADKGLLFPVDLGGRGSASIGGMISTNAGGERVVRFGMIREQVLGLEVVLADGTVLDMMDCVVKNNAGYDLRQLFIGSEGTLGIVTRAVLRLRPAFSTRNTALLALTSMGDMPAVLNRIESGLGGTLSAFELLWPEFLTIMTGGERSQHRNPVTSDAAGYVLMEAEGGDTTRDGERFMALLESMLEDGSLSDVAVAQSEREAEAIWAIRNDVPVIVKAMYPFVPFDISVPIATMGSYVEELRETLARRWAEARLLVFGHAADNNLHLVVTIGPDTHKQAKEISKIVYAGVKARRGSISAEHGIGLDKREALVYQRTPEVMNLMRTLKKTLDPENRLNPGKVV